MPRKTPKLGKTGRTVRPRWTLAPEFEQDYRDANAGGWARVGTLLVPPVFEYVVIEHDPHNRDEAKFLAVLMYAVEDGEIGLRGVYSSTHDVDEVLEMLRQDRPIEDWKREAFMLLAADQADSGFDIVEEVLAKSHGWSPAPKDDPERIAVISTAIREAHKTPLRRRRNRITEAHLREVADVYRTAWAAGESPTTAVMDHFSTTHSTAARWVGLARKAGHLGAADGSKGGEVT